MKTYRLFYRLMTCPRIFSGNLKHIEQESPHEERSQEYFISMFRSIAKTFFTMKIRKNIGVVSNADSVTSKHVNTLSSVRKCSNKHNLCRKKFGEKILILKKVIYRLLIFFFLFVGINQWKTYQLLKRRFSEVGRK